MRPLAIAFVVQGEGRGHMTQAMALASFLRDAGHRISAVLVGGSPYRSVPEYFRDGIGAPVETFDAPTQVPGGDGRGVSVAATARDAARRMPRFFAGGRRVHTVTSDADVVVSFLDLVGGASRVLFHTGTPAVAVAHNYVFLHPALAGAPGGPLARRFVLGWARATAWRTDAVVALSFGPLEAAQEGAATPERARGGPGTGGGVRAGGGDTAGIGATSGRSKAAGRDAATDRGARARGSSPGADDESSGIGSGDPRLIVAPPLLLPQLGRMRPRDDGHLLGYALNAGYGDLLAAWQRRNPDVTVHCYVDGGAAALRQPCDPGFHAHGLDDRRFLDHLAGCRAYVGSAGFESICEAYHLGKPVLAVPTAGQHEQTLNAWDAERAGAARAGGYDDLDDFWRRPPVPSEEAVRAFRAWVARAPELLVDVVERAAARGRGGGGRAATAAKGGPDRATTTDPDATTDKGRTTGPERHGTSEPGGEVTLRVERVDGRRGVARFVDAAWRVRAKTSASALEPAGARAPAGTSPAVARNGNPSRWIPPLRMVVKDLLDTRNNPFYAEADRALYIASRGEEVVGRIGAIENRWHNRHHADRTGFFGFFECVPDPEAARALLGTAEEWLAGRGLTSARGPMSPSMNHECGLLVDGFDTDPVLMTSWDPPYAGELLEGAGYLAVQDLLAYYLRTDAGAPLVPDRLRRLAERTARKTRVTFRELDVRTLEREARKVHRLYNEAWAGNWGFVPPSWEEFWHIAKDLKGVLAKGFSFVAEVDDEVVGFMMIARDVNRVLRTMPSGRLWPWNLVRLLRRVPRVPSGRVVLLGLTDEYRNRGLFPLFTYEAVRRAYETRSVGAEASWILEQNEAMRAPLEAMGLRPYKRWRIYEKAVGTRG